jgi:preprotein translocase subunit SecF
MYQGKNALFLLHNTNNGAKQRKRDTVFMKSTIISMVIVLCILAVVPLLLFGDKGILARLNIDFAGGSDPRAKAPQNITTVTTDQKVQVYKWRDEYGVMQFTSAPPPEGQQAEMVELTPNTNIIKAVAVAEDGVEQKRSGPTVMTTGSPSTPGGMKEMLDATTGLKDGLNEEQHQQQQLIEQILGNQR